jgi:hypothetical protein
MKTKKTTTEKPKRITRAEAMAALGLSEKNLELLKSVQARTGFAKYALEHLEEKTRQAAEYAETFFRAAQGLRDSFENLENLESLEGLEDPEDLDSQHCFFCGVPTDSHFCKECDDEAEQRSRMHADPLEARGGLGPRRERGAPRTRCS